MAATIEAKDMRNERWNAQKSRSSRFENVGVEMYSESGQLSRRAIFQ
jgi:hypothetical protein